jgi:hypothetical protein
MTLLKKEKNYNTIIFVFSVEKLKLLAYLLEQNKRKKIVVLTEIFFVVYLNSLSN